LAVPVGEDPSFDAVLETALYHRTDEKDAVERFYADILGLKKVVSWDDGMAFRVGPGVLLLFDREKLPAREEPMAAHGTSGTGHVCLLAREGDYDAWKARLEGERVAITHEHEWESGFRSCYFSDPAGNLLEIADGDLWPK
jgi:catechol 2,3-dioxygenase-like lactoylglutathione lyase family enzyme